MNSGREHSVAFQITRNGRKVCTAGLAGKPGVLTAILHCALRADRDELMLDIGGYESASRQGLTWANVPIKVGDEVTVRVVEDARLSRVKRRVDMGDDSKKHEIARLRKAAKKQGYKLVKNAATVKAG